MSSPLRLLLIDTPALHRRCLAAFLSRRRGIRVVGDAASGEGGLGQVQSLRPDVVLVEPEVPDGGSTLVANLHAAAPECALVVLTLGSDESSVRRTLLAGARAYLRKDCEPQELVRVIERVAAGELVLGRGVSESILLIEDDHPHGSPLEGLSERELEVLRLIAQGLSNPEIASALCITENTVKGHVTRILDKLGLENRVQIATYALSHGLAGWPPRSGGRANPAVEGRVKPLHSRMAAPARKARLV